MEQLREDALYVIRQGRSAVRQLRMGVAAHTLTEEAALRHLDKVDAALNQVLGTEGFGDEARQRLADLIVIEGGRR
jgi:hypothetical protein